MVTKSSPYVCTECGWKTAKWVGRCGECQQWGTVQEVGANPGGSRVTAANVPADRAARPITTVTQQTLSHWPTAIGELDRVLGGGIVPGAAILLSGEPGVGKSTLLLEVAARVARSGARVLYVSAEESVNQVTLRASRTNALEPTLFIASETDLGVLLGQVEAINPQLLIVDSVQTVTSEASDGLAGQPGQVREVAQTLVRLAKSRDMPVLIVGHVTKDGTIAGPRLLEHLVDVVCHFEGDRQTALRFVRALKNRFGPTDEVGCFEMTGDGIAEVPDPSALFISQGVPVSGTCITIAMEGRRPLPVEIQALVSASAAPNPRRVVNGVDASRVAMLLAVLERRAGLSLADKDVYVSTVGGVRLTEPAADLAIAVAIAASAKDFALPHGFAAVGEISLAGEVRPVAGDRQRRTEAERLGYSAIIDHGCASIQEALRQAKAASSSERDRELDRAF